jgi:uncharacterized membrane protein
MMPDEAHSAPGETPRVPGESLRVPGESLRVPGLDVARGLAIVAMVVYHFTWDLSYLGFIDAEVRSLPGWVWFARGIAASFLALVGISLVLAQATGQPRSAFFKRLGWIVAAALLVTGATAWLFPQSFVFFGILHMIALGSVLVLPFLRLPFWMTAATALAVLLIPLLGRFNAFSSPWLIWLGLGDRTPISNDFVPVFPWFVFILAGVALAKAVDFTRFSGPAPTVPPLRLLYRAGRNSLPIYLLHQPILFGMLSLIAVLHAPRPDREAGGFNASCQSQCRAAGGEAAVCVALCQCAVVTLKKEGLWAAVLADKVDPAMNSRITAISQSCGKSARSGLQ